MGTITKQYDFTNGTMADADEVNANFDALYTLVTGNIENVNIGGSAAIDSSKLAEIPLTKLGDYAANITEFGTVLSAGDTVAPASVTSGLHEVEVLRDRVAALRGYQTVKYMNTSPAATPAIWTEPRIAGPNLLPNPGFDLHSSVTVTDAPDGWTLNGTPTNCFPAGPSYVASGKVKKHLNVVADAPLEGVKVTVGGLKASTKYLVGALYAVVSGELNIITSGALASGTNYGNLALTDNSVGGLESLQGIIKTTGVPGDVTVSFISSSAAEFNLLYVWMYELTESHPYALPSIPARTVTSSTLTDYAPGVNAWTWGTHSALTIAQYVPAPGYRFIYEVTLSYTSEPFNISAGDSITSPNNSYSIFGFRIRLDTGGGANTVAGPYLAPSRNNGGDGAFGGVLSMKYVIDNPTPGLTYTFTVDVGAYGQGSGTWSECRINPLMEAEQAVSTARLIVEKL